MRRPHYRWRFRPPGVETAIAVPSYQHSVAKTQTRVCVTNLRNIEIAKAQGVRQGRG